MNKSKLFSKPVMITITMLVVLFYAKEWFAYIIAGNFYSISTSIDFISNFAVFITIIAMTAFYNKINTPISLGKISPKTLVTMLLSLSLIILVLFTIGKITNEAQGLVIYNSDDYMSMYTISLYISNFIISPICQIIVFYGVLFNVLSSYSKKVLFTLSTFSFVVFSFHGITFGFGLTMFITLIALSIVLILARLKTGGVLLPIVIHSLFNIYYLNIEHLDKYQDYNFQ